MKSILLFLAMLLVSSSIYAKGAERSFEVKSTNYADGVLLEANNQDQDLQLTVSGPDNMRFTQKHFAGDPAFLDINDANGQQLTDGFYKYEVKQMPSRTYSREESSNMPDRNSIKNTTGGRSVSAVNGSFRVSNGQIVDTELIEYDAEIEQGMAK